MDGILITHEHMDHIKGLGVVARRHGIPMYATKGTIDAIMENRSVGEIDGSLFRVIRPEVPFRIGDMTVQPISTSHDAADPVAYVMRREQKSMAVITDLGKYDDYIVDKLQGLDGIIVGGEP